VSVILQGGDNDGDANLTTDELPWLVREVSRRALLGYLGREPTEAEIAAAMPEVKALLHQVVTAYDLCGLTTLCWEAEEVDPWEALEDHAQV
jgi:hypothetical protein